MLLLSEKSQERMSNGFITICNLHSLKYFFIARDNIVRYVLAVEKRN